MVQTLDSKENDINLDPSKCGFKCNVDIHPVQKATVNGNALITDESLTYLAVTFLSYAN